MKGTVMLMFIARIIAGVCGNVKVPVIAYITDVSTAETSSKNFGLMMLGVGIGVILGPLLIIILSALGGIEAVFTASAVLALSNMLFMLLKWPRYTPSEVAPFSEALPWMLVKNTLCKSKTLTLYGIMNFFDSFALTMVLVSVTTVPIVIFGEDNWGSQQIGMFMVFFGIGICFGSGVLLKLMLKCVSELSVLKFGYIVSCAAFAILWLIGMQSTLPALMYLGVIPVAVGFVSNPVQTSFATREVDWHVVGRLSGAYSVMETLGKVAAPMLVAPVFQATVDSAPSMVYLCASLVLIPAVLMAFLVGRFQTAAKGRADSAKPAALPVTLGNEAPATIEDDKVAVPSPEFGDCQRAL